MPLFRPPRPASMTLNLAPMVDVMMCLIVFFLLASRLAGAQFHGVRLARSESAQDLAREPGRRATVINVRCVGEEAEYVVNVWEGGRLAERSLPAVGLAEYLASSAGGAPESARCLVRIDRDVPYRHVETVLRACGRAGLASVVFGAERTEAEAVP